MKPIQLQEEISQLKYEIKHLELKLTMVQSAFLNTVGKSIDGVVILDQEKMVVYTNYAAINLFDRNISDLLGEPLDIDLSLIQQSNRLNASTELRIPNARGSYSIVEATVFNTEWNNQPAYVVNFRDITQRKNMESALAYKATHDNLTNLLNASDFENQVNEAILAANDHQEGIALLYLDLDNFKCINDTLGHSAGDKLLQKIATLLQESVRHDDKVARLGGDEFAVLITRLKNRKNAANVSQTILSKLEQETQLDKQLIQIHASIGISTYPFDGINVNELIKHADAAMYIAKDSGKNQYHFFSEPPLD